MFFILKIINMKKSVLLLFLFLFLISHELFASHLMGGEITWTCTGNGRYIFEMKLYRDCNGIPGPTDATLNSDCPGLGGGIYLNLISQTDDSPVCNSSGPAITCAGATGTTAGAVERFILRSAP